MHTVECKVILLHGTVIYSGLSLRARSRDFPPATMSMTPSYFRRKQKENKTTRTPWLLSSQPY